MPDFGIFSGLGVFLFWLWGRETVQRFLGLLVDLLFQWLYDVVAARFRRAPAA